MTDNKERDEVLQRQRDKPGKAPEIERQRDKPGKDPWVDDPWGVRPASVGVDAPLTDQIVYIQSLLLRNLERAAASRDSRILATLAREMRANHDLLARLTGQLVERRAVQTNVTHEVEQMDVPALKAKLDELRAELDTIDDDGPTIQ